MWSFFQFLNDDCTLTILDIGAVLTDVPSYQGLIDTKRARLIGFEPDAEACRLLNESYGNPHKFFPYFAGDGCAATYHQTNWGPTGSLFEPNTPLLDRLHNLSEVTVSVAHHPVTTVRIDDIQEVEDVDFIKIDAQGSELSIFQNASRALADAVLIQTEVVFLELYKNQPMFSDIDAFLRNSGFQFHDFLGMGSRSFKPVVNPRDPEMGFRQRVWGDAYYVKDWMTWGALPPAKLKKLAALLHDIVESYDLAYLALSELDRQLGTEIASRYLNRLEEGGHGSSGLKDGASDCWQVGDISISNGNSDVLNQERQANGLERIEHHPRALAGRRLHIGGKEKLEGWEVLNVTSGPCVDHVCNASDLSRFANSTFSEIYASHVVEHFDYKGELSETLKEWNRVLTPGGQLLISVPDLDRLAELFVSRGSLSSDERLFVMRMMFGGHSDEYDYHVVGLNQEFLAQLLRDSGFVNMRRVEEFGIFEDTSTMVFKGVRISLNMVAEKGQSSVAELANDADLEKIADQGCGVHAGLRALAVNISGGLTLSVPASLRCRETYILLEQERWFEREWDFVRKSIEVGAIAVDIGANVGIYTLPLALAVGESGRVLAFELGSETRRHLEAGCRMNSLNNITISKCALSDSEGIGWQVCAPVNGMVAGVGQELPNDSERVRVSTLDVLGRECSWPPIDFVRIGATYQTERIVAGGGRFFSHHSPLVMYPIKHGNHRSNSLRWMFEALGYRTFRLLGDATCLVPLGSDEALDPMESNLFAVKADRAMSMASKGLLVLESVTHVLNDKEQSSALEAMLRLPYATALEISAEDVFDCPYGDAVIMYAACRFLDISPARRVAALNAAFAILVDSCQSAPTPTALATLVRIALDLGRCGAAVDALNQLVQVKNVELDQPFFPPCARYESIPPGDREADWFVAASYEQVEMSGSYSSYPGSSNFARLKWLCDGPFSSAEIYRRMVLRAFAGGMAFDCLNSDHAHANSGCWTASGILTLQKLR